MYGAKKNEKTEFNIKTGASTMKEFQEYKFNEKIWKKINDSFVDHFRLDKYSFTHDISKTVKLTVIIKKYILISLTCRPVSD